jgi:hypothetical protein
MTRPSITAAGAARLEAAFPLAAIAAASAGSQRRRLVSGVAVPYDVAGVVSSGQRVIFHRGALDASARPPALFGHDRGRPLGRVVDAADAGDRLTASARLSATPAGDEALTLAEDGALMFSVGVAPLEADEDADGTLHVYRGDWLELSLLPIGAYAGATIDNVAAGGAHDFALILAEGGDGDDDQADGDDDGDETDGDESDETDGDAGDETSAELVTAGARHPASPRPRPVPVAAAAGRRRASTPAPVNPYAGVTLRHLARMLHAGRGDPTAARRVATILAAQGPTALEAALTDVTLVGTDNVAAAYRAAYQAELVSIISWGTPLIDALRQGDLERGDYPTKTFNTWEKAPTVALQAAEKDPIASTAVKITPASATVQTWAGGNDISQQTLDLGSPSFVEDYIRAAAVDYARKTDTYAVTTLLAAATDVPLTVGDDFVTVVAKLVGALDPATTPPGGLFLAMAYNIGAGLIGVKRDDGPAFWDGNVGFGTFTPTTNVGGLSAFIDPNMPDDTYLLGHRQGATWYDLPGTPFSLRAVNVGLLGLDVAIYGYGALGIQYPGSMVKATTAVAAARRSS